MATGHLKIGGSSIKRTGLCSGSVAAIEALGERKGGDAAERGTRIHAWFEKYMTGDLKPTGRKIVQRDIDEARIAALAGLKTKEVITSLGMRIDQFKVEEMLVFHPDYPEAGGTPDMDGAEQYEDMAVIDLKCGNGQIDPEQNEQLLFYACARLNNMDPYLRATLTDCHLIIVQPNEDGSEVAVRKWTLPVADLHAWEALFRTYIDRVRTNPNDRTPGDHCKELWCDARTTCLSYLNWVDQSANNTLAGFAPPAGSTPGQTLAHLLNVDKNVSDLLKQAKEDAKSLLMRDPEGVPGYYLDTDVLGDREWENAKAAEKALKTAGFSVDEVAPRKLLSVAQTEKLVKARISAFASVPEKVEECEKLKVFALPPITRPPGAPRLKKGTAPVNTMAAFVPPKTEAACGVADATGNSANAVAEPVADTTAAPIDFTPPKELAGTIPAA